MLIKKTRPWELSENQATSEHIFFNRRKFLKTSGLLAAGVGSGLLAACEDGAEADTGGAISLDPNASKYPAPRNPDFMLSREITREDVSSRYNNSTNLAATNVFRARRKILRSVPGRW